MWRRHSCLRAARSAALQPETVAFGDAQAGVPAPHQRLLWSTVVVGRRWCLGSQFIVLRSNFMVLRAADLNLAPRVILPRRPGVTSRNNLPEPKVLVPEAPLDDGESADKIPVRPAVGGIEGSRCGEPA